MSSVPGYSFQDITKTKFNLNQNCKVVNGYRQTPKMSFGIGKSPIDVDSVRFLKPTDHIRYDPSLTYGRVKSASPCQFHPHWQIYDKKALKFSAYFKKSVIESPNEQYRVRHVNIIYFLEDDTLTVLEPEVDNCGFMQGRLIRRCKIPKDSEGNNWHWKDLNLGIDVPMYGFVFHIVNCDLYTRNFLESQGIVLGPEEEMPLDPYITERNLKYVSSIKKPANVDKHRHFFENDKTILRFYAMWDDRMSECGDRRQFVLYYHLATDCVQVREVYPENCGRDPFPLLVKKMKLPKNWKYITNNFPSSAEEETEEDTSFYSLHDFQVGATVSILGRRFLIYDCDNFTRNYYKNILHLPQGAAIDVTEKKPSPPKQAPPPHSVLGAPEDTIQNCLRLRPVAPKKDFLQYCINANKYLRYEAVFDVVHPEDAGRKFVFSYHLADGTLKISEPAVRNSGFVGGTYLKATKVPKPDANRDNPECYTPEDFCIGACINVFGQRFIITDADLRVYHYMVANPEKFSSEVMENMISHMITEGLLT